MRSTRTTPTRSSTPTMPMIARSTTAAAVLVLAGLLPLAGCGDDGPAPNPPAPRTITGGGQPATPSAGAAGAGGAASGDAVERLSTADSDPKIIEIAGFVFDKPATWGWQQPGMRFRTLQYAVPGRDGNPAAELIFSLFRGDGGPIDANIQRWVGQFRAEDGGAVEPIRETFTVAGVRVEWIELEGAYMGMGAAGARPGMAQLGAIVIGSGRTVFIRLLGARETVGANKDAFRAMVESMKVE